MSTNEPIKRLNAAFAANEETRDPSHWASLVLEAIESVAALMAAGDKTLHARANATCEVLVRVQKRLTALESRTAAHACTVDESGVAAPSPELPAWLAAVYEACAKEDAWTDGKKRLGLLDGAFGVWDGDSRYGEYIWLKPRRPAPVSIEAGKLADAIWREWTHKTEPTLGSAVRRALAAVAGEQAAPPDSSPAPVAGDFRAEDGSIWKTWSGSGPPNAAPVALMPGHWRRVAAPAPVEDGDDLAPCWYCRSDSRSTVENESHPSGDVAVTCNVCGQRGPLAGDSEDAARLWEDQQERRATAPAPASAPAPDGGEVRWVPGEWAWKNERGEWQAWYCRGGAVYAAFSGNSPSEAIDTARRMGTPVRPAFGGGE